MKTVLLLASSFLLFACNGNLNNNAPAKIIAHANEILNEYPDSALHIANSILRDTASGKLSEKAFVQLYLLKEKAFSKKRQLDSLLDYSNRVMEKGDALGDSTAMMESLVYIVGDVDRSVKKKLEEKLPVFISYAQRQGLDYPFAKLSAMYGIILASRGEVEKSQPYLLQAHRAMDSLNKKAEQVSITLAIASNFSEIKSRDQALKYYKIAQDLADDVKDSSLMSSVLMNIGVFHNEDKYSDSADWYFDQSLMVLPVSAGPFQRIKILYNRYITDMNNGHLSESRSGFRQLLAECKSMNFTEGEAVVSKALGTVFFKEKSFDSAQVYFNNTIQIADRLNDNLLKMQSLIDLESVYVQRGNLSQAYLIQKKHKPIQDSLFSSEKQIELHELETNFQLDKRQIENKLLKADLSSRRIQLIMLVCLLASVGLVVYNLKKRNRYQAERNRSYEKLIEKYKEEIRNSDHEKRSLEERLNDSGKSVGSSDLFSRITSYYESDKPFLNVGLKIDEVANQLGVTGSEIQEVLKQKDFKNFSGFTNYYRVMEVRRMFEDPKYDHVKLDAIGALAGFRAKQTFYLAFELHTGMKPGFYRRGIRSREE